MKINRSHQGRTAPLPLRGQAPPRHDARATPGRTRLSVRSTPMDIMLEDGRRPTLTVVMDTATRAVVGWSMT